MGRQGAVTSTIERSPDAVFRAITDVRSLPDWNERILAVHTQPERLVAGAEWVVEMKILGRRFHSRSLVVELAPDARRFVHRSAPDDDNPSHTIWTWEVVPSGDGAAVTLAWELHPRTPGRRVAAFIRSHMIPAEARASLRQLEVRC
jgi:uncharacterized protein YndB with AHSA1/START domain